MHPELVTLWNIVMKLNSNEYEVKKARLIQE